MINKLIMGATCAFFMTASFNVNAIPISADWQSPGDGLITYDQNTGLEWLDLTYTDNRSYNDISSKFGIGMELEGWRYASTTEVATLWNSFGGNGTYTGWSAGNNGVYEVFAGLLGDTLCDGTYCTVGQGRSIGITETLYSNFQNRRVVAIAMDLYWNSLSPDQDSFQINGYSLYDGSPSSQYGSYLVRGGSVSAPEPSIAILMASGLIAFGVVRRKVKV